MGSNHHYYSIDLNAFGRVGEKTEVAVNWSYIKNTQLRCEVRHAIYYARIADT